MTSDGNTLIEKFRASLVKNVTSDDPPEVIVVCQISCVSRIESYTGNITLAVSQLYVPSLLWLTISILGADSLTSGERCFSIGWPITSAKCRPLSGQAINIFSLSIFIRNQTSGPESVPYLEFLLYRSCERRGLLRPPPCIVVIKLTSNTSH